MWLKIDDGFSQHPKVLQAGAAGVALWVSGACYAARYETDGLIPLGVVPHLPHYTADALAALVKVVLWESVEGGYQIHDWLKYNPPASEQKAKREAHAARMRALREKSRDSARDHARDSARDGSREPHVLCQSGLGVRVRAVEISDSSDLSQVERGAGALADRVEEVKGEQGGFALTPEFARGKPKKARAAQTPISLPDWMPQATWDAWRAHRRAIHKPLTPQAEALGLRTLDELRSGGHDPVAVVEQSMGAGWTGLFPLRRDQAQATEQPRRSGLEVSAAEIGAQRQRERDLETPEQREEARQHLQQMLAMTAGGGR